MPGSRLGAVVAEIRRRHVVRVASVYAVVAWAVVQVAATVQPYLRLPSWVVTALIVLAIAGLPLALVLAWLFDVTPTGIERTNAAAQAEPPGESAAAIAPAEAARKPSGERPVPRATAPRRRLRLALGAVGAVLLGALGLLVALTASRGRPPLRPVLAVLPFENLGPATDAYFADGLTDEVRGRLAGIAGLRVIGGMSTRQYKGTTKSPREIAHELGATHLLTGSVRWERTPDGGRVRVSSELVRAADQASVWAEPDEGPLGDVFALQARVAERVAGALDVTLLARERRATLPAPPTQNPAAYDAYLHGIAYGVETFHATSPAERRAAGAAFQQAIALDPRFAAAHARLAQVYLNERDFGQDSGMLARARASAARAMALDSTRLESRLAQASVLLASDDAAGALRALEAAARIAPSNAEVQYQLGIAYAMLGHPEGATPNFQRAAELEPRWSSPVGQLAGMHDLMFEYEQAIHTREREIALSTSATAAFARGYQAVSYLLWRADTAAARRQLTSDDAGPLLYVLICMPAPPAGIAIWLHAFPPAVLAAKDTLTLAGYLRENWLYPPEYFHFMKARHFWLTGRRERARAQADSLIALLEPALRPGADTLRNWAPRAVLAEAYAYAGRAADAARSIDEHVERQRRGPAPDWYFNLPNALVTAAYVDVLIGRRDLAVARLAEALRLPSGQWISPALLRVDPSWAPLRGHPAFERLIAGNP